MRIRWAFVAALLALVPTTARAQAAPTSTIVSTSGVSHRDVADYRLSPAWTDGMPKGANARWRTYMDTTVDQITASDPDVVLHTGDMVEGRWYAYAKGTPHVYGPRRNWAQKTRMIHRAADTVYPWMRQWWAGNDVLWAMGDHEVGDIGPKGHLAPEQFRYKAHGNWNRAWRRHFGQERYAVLRGNVGIVTLDPFVKWRRGVLPRISGTQLTWLRDQIGRLRDDGAEWIIVQSETPALGPNRPLDGHGTSGLILENGDRLWRELVDLDIDLFLAAEFHADTTHSNGGAAPLHIVHGGSEGRASWLQIDVRGGDRLELTLHESVGSLTGSHRIWAPTSARANNRPVPGTPAVTGSATLHADGSITHRDGWLREGV